MNFSNCSEPSCNCPHWGRGHLYLIISMSLPFRVVNTMHSLITRVFSCNMGVGTARGRCCTIITELGPGGSMARSV